MQTKVGVRARLDMRPDAFLKWAGGKGQLIKQLQPLFPAQFNRYFEPFLGSGAVFFYLQSRSANAVLNDANPNLITTYRHIKEQLDELLVVLTSLKRVYLSLDAAAQQAEYYRIRDRYNQLPSGSVEKSALLIFLNKTGFNGLYRESKKGGFNVPFGRHKNPAIFDTANLRGVAQVLKRTTLLNTGFDQAVATAQAGDLVYFDPPYMPLSATASFTSYTANEFGPVQQTELAHTVRQLTRRGVQVMVSNSSHDFIRELYQDFHQHEVKAARVINSKAEGRGKISELVITNYQPPEQLVPVQVAF